MVKTHQMLIKHGIEYFESKGFYRIKSPRGLFDYSKMRPDFLLVKHDGKARPHDPERPSSLYIETEIKHISVIWGEALVTKFGGFPGKTSLIIGMKNTLSDKDLWGNFIPEKYRKERILDGPTRTRLFFKYSGPVELTVTLCLVHETGLWICDPQH